MMTRVSAEKVKAKLDTHEAVCAERWKETILRIKRLEAIFIAFSGATMLMLVTIIIKQLQEDVMTYGYVKKANDHDYQADGFKELKKIRSTTDASKIIGPGVMTDKDFNKLTKAMGKKKRRKGYGV